MFNSLISHLYKLQFLNAALVGHKNIRLAHLRMLSKSMIDNSLCRLIFYLGKKVYSRKEHINISKIAKFGCEML